MLTSLWPHLWSETSVGLFPGDGMRSWVWKVKFNMDLSYTDPSWIMFLALSVPSSSAPLFSFLEITSVQLLSRIQLFVTQWTAACQASLTITNSQSLLKLMSIESVMPSTISSSVVPSPPAFNLSQHQVLFKWVSSSHQVAKVLEFHLQH